MKIAAVGDNCMDVYDSLGTAYPGGNPVNVAVNFTRLGGQAAYLGAVGTDRYGDLMQDALKKKGVNLSHIHVIEGSTAITHVDMDGSNRVLGDYDPGVMDQFKLTDADIDFISGQDLMVSVVWGMVEHDL